MDDNLDRKHVSSTTNKPAFPVNVFGFAGLAILLCILSFYGGISYQKHQGHSTSSPAAARFGGPRGFAGRRGGIGTVTAASASSITVQSQRTGASTTYTINSSTQITNNGASVAASTIQVGDTVLVRPASAGSSIAATIEISPSFGAPPASSTQPSSTTSTPAQST